MEGNSRSMTVTQMVLCSDPIGVSVLARCRIIDLCRSDRASVTGPCRDSVGVQQTGLTKSGLRAFSRHGVFGPFGGVARHPCATAARPHPERPGQAACGIRRRTVRSAFLGHRSGAHRVAAATTVVALPVLLLPPPSWRSLCSRRHHIVALLLLLPPPPSWRSPCSRRHHRLRAHCAPAATTVVALTLILSPCSSWHSP